MKITTLDKAEQKLAAGIVSIGLMGMKNSYDPKTEQECVELYKNAEEISSAAKMALKDGLQGKALLNAKKIICGDEWNATRLTKNIVLKWNTFLGQINLLRTTGERIGSATDTVHKLLDFAGYKEKEEELIADGVEVTPINTASHYRETKKIAQEDGKTTPEDISKVFTQAVKTNDGVIPSTAKEVKEVVAKASRKIYVQELFIKEVGVCPPEAISSMTLGTTILSILPDLSEAQWKKWYRDMSKLIHPDTGGSSSDFAILNTINEAMTLTVENREKKQLRKEWKEDYETWKEDKGYKSDFVDEKDL